MDLSKLLADIQLNWLDILMGGIFAIAIIRGLMAGFSRTFTTFVGGILGFWLAANHYPELSQKLSLLVSAKLTRDLLAFFLIFIVVYLIFSIAGLIIRKLFRVLHLSWMDRLLGGVVGFAKAFVVAAAIAFILTISLPENSKLLKESYLYPNVSQLTRLVIDMVPEDMKAKFMWKWRRLQMQFARKKQQAM